MVAEKEKLLTKVLVVDDKEENLIAMEAVLSDVDVEVITAKSGAEALKKMINNEFALVLLDVQMPEMDGFETAQLMCGSEKTKNTPIIFLTALNKEDKFVEKGYNCGAVDYILKPVNSEILKHKVIIFKKLYEQNRLIKSQSEKLISINSELKKMFEIELQARKAKDALIMEQSKLATMGEMIGYMAHQWKQPLNILSLCFQDIDDIMDEKEITDEHLVSTIKYGMDQLMYMADTIDDFRNYLRPDRESDTFSIGMAVVDVLKLIGSYVTRRGIKLKYRCSLGNGDAQGEKNIQENLIHVCGQNRFECENCPIMSIRIKGFQNEFKQVMINLINNAKDAIEDSNENKMWLDEDFITIDAAIEDNKIVISISDTGGGIPEDIKDKIFEPYFTTKKNKGTGIGLNMVKNIIEVNFNGELHYNNTKDGAEFVLSFDRAPVE